MAKVKTIPNGTHVSWGFRDTRGHGVITGVHKPGTSSATTEYSIREEDHHVSSSGKKEASVVYHYGSDIDVLSKDAAPARYVLGVAYQAGPDPRIQKGADDYRDFFSPTELESAAWYFAKSQMDVGLFHTDGTTGSATVVESYIYRGPDWVIKNVDGDQVIVKSGDWLLGAILDERSWDMYQRGMIHGWSPQGAGTRRASMTKSATPAAGEVHIHIHTGGD